jgi:hypothetical protein
MALSRLIESGLVDRLCTPFEASSKQDDELPTSVAAALVDAARIIDSSGASGLSASHTASVCRILAELCRGRSLLDGPELFGIDGIESVSKCQSSPRQAMLDAYLIDTTAAGAWNMCCRSLRGS